MAFVGVPLRAGSFSGTSVTGQRALCNRSTRVPTAELKLVPGVPPGEDARDNAPLRYYVPRPEETYEDRGFATILPKTWEGEINTIGAGDVPPLTKEAVEEAKFVEVDSASTGAFLEYASMMKEERAESLRRQAERNAMPLTGRATCGPSEGKEVVSNYVEVLVDGVKCTEYWGTPNGPVPRVFGDVSE